MSKIVKLIAGSLLFLAFSACGEELMDYSIDTKVPVVESYLQEGTNTLTVKIYSMEVYLKEGYNLSKPIKDLLLSINNRELTETTSGTYTVDLGNDTIQENQQYDLRFEYNGKVIEASATVPEPVRNLQIYPTSLTQPSYYWDSSDTTEVLVSWDDPGKDYYQVYIKSPETSGMPSFGMFGQRMMQPFKGNTYRANTRDFRSAGTHWIYIYRVNKDYVDLYERVSSSDLANPVSSIRNAFGIFTSLSVAKIPLIVYESE